MSKESDWDKVVLVCVVILAIVALFKFLFWVSIIVVIAGIIWIIINLFSGDPDLSWIPALMIVVGIILTVISYQIGYGFEKSELGKPVVDDAKVIVQTDNTIKDIKQNATNQMIGAVQQSTKDVQK